MYEKYHEYGERPLFIENIAIELKLNVDDSIIYRVITYLYDNNLVWGEKLGDTNYPSQIRINENGIDFVERVMNQTHEKTQDEALRQKLKLLLNDANPASRIRGFLDLTKSYSSLTGLVISVVKKFLKQKR
jgi:hypothetical protein